MKQTLIAMASAASLATFACGFPLSAAATASTGPVPAGPAFQVNTGGELPAQQAAVAVADDGSFVVAWAAYTSSPQFSGSILARRFAADGTPLSGDILVTSLLPYAGMAPDVAVASDGSGNFGVAWVQQESWGGTPMMRLFTAGGTARGASFCAQTGCAATLGAPFALGMDSTGRFVTAVGAANQGIFDGNFTASLTAQRYSGDGSPLDTVPFTVASATTLNAYQADGLFSVSVAMNRASGDFAVGWVQEQSS